MQKKHKYIREQIWAEGLSRDQTYPPEPSNCLIELKKSGFCTFNHGPLSDQDLTYLAKHLAKELGGFEISNTQQIEATYQSDFKTQTHDAVPFHNDGLYLSSPPHFVILYCERAPDSGGETVLLRGDQVVDQLPPELSSFFRREEVTITIANRVQHRRLIDGHPTAGEDILLFFDPEMSPSCNISHRGSHCSEFDELKFLVQQPQNNKHMHKWSNDDVLIFDNYRMLHARASYAGPRLLRRIALGPVRED